MKAITETGVFIHNKLIGWKYIFIGLIPTIAVVGLLVLIQESIWPALLTYHTLCLCIPLVSGCYFKESGLILSNRKHWLPITVLLSVILLTLSVIGSRYMNLPVFMPKGWEILIGRIQPWRWFVIYSLLMNSFLEEYFWRGFLLPKTGIVKGAGLFWLVHVATMIIFIDPLNALILTIPVFVFGLLWGWMRKRFESLYPCILTHLSADISIFYVISQIMK